MNRHILPARILAGMTLAFCAAGAFAGDATVTDAWVRATAPGQDSAAVSLQIMTHQDAKLVAVSSPAAERVEIHIMKHENGMMMMRQVGELALPANRQVKLGSGSHLMLTGLKNPLNPGDRVQLVLTLEYADRHRETITTSAEVRPLSHDMDNMPDHDMGGHGH